VPERWYLWRKDESHQHGRQDEKQRQDQEDALSRCARDYQGTEEQQRE